MLQESTNNKQGNTAEHRQQDRQVGAHFRLRISTEQTSYSRTEKQAAPPSHSFSGPLTLAGSLQLLPTSAQLMFPLLHSSAISKSPCPKPKCGPPFIANFLYSGLKGSSSWWSREYKNAYTLRDSKKSSSYFGNMTLEQPPKCRPLFDSTYSKTGPRMLTAYIFLVKKLLSEALKRSLRVQLKGKSRFIRFSFWLKGFSSRLSTANCLTSKETSILPIAFRTVFCRSATIASIYLQTYSGVGYANWWRRGKQSPCFLYSFQSQRKREVQCLWLMMANRLFFMSSYIFSKWLEAVFLCCSRELQKFSLALRCFSSLERDQRCSSQWARVCFWCLGLQSLQRSRLFLHFYQQQTATAS